MDGRGFCATGLSAVAPIVANYGISSSVMNISGFGPIAVSGTLLAPGSTAVAGIGDGATLLEVAVSFDLTVVISLANKVTLILHGWDGLTNCRLES